MSIAILYRYTGLGLRTGEVLTTVDARREAWASLIRPSSGRVRA